MAEETILPSIGAGAGVEPTKVEIFNDKKIRKVLHEEEWWFSVVDICEALTDSPDPGAYWRKLKQRLVEEGSQVVTFCHGLKLPAADGKNYLTDCSTPEGILRIVQSVPSPKAEPFKQWLAKVGYERMQEMTNPEMALNRSREYWQKQGRSQKWIQQRMTGQETRNKLTDYWGDHGVEKGKEFAILTNIIHQEWSDLSVKSHKDLKGLKTENLRDHMSEEELIFTALAELSTRRISEKDQTVGLEENKIPAKKGGKIAKDARVALENTIGESVVTGQNFLPRAKAKKKLN